MSDCIEWQGCRKNYGYGRRAWQGKQAYAHRVAYCEANGLSLEDIAGRIVRHECDNPACVNPEHLVLGTQADNLADMAERGRSTVGARHGMSKLTQEQADAIRRLYTPGSRELGVCALARRFGVAHATVSRLVNGVSWRDGA